MTHLRIRSVLAGLTALALLACDGHAPSVSAPRSADASPTAARHPRGASGSTLLPPPGRFLGGLTLLRCTPIAADSVTQLVGPDGGTILVGPHQLVFPAGSLDSTVAITAIAPSDTVNRVILLPDGLQFSGSATLTMSYANCPGLTILPLRRIVWIDSSLNILQLLPSLDDFFSQSVSAKLNHFSDYAVAW